QGYVDGDYLVPAHDHEVDVPDRSPHRVALQLAGHGQVRRAVHLEGEQGVETGLGGQGGPQLTAVHRYGLGIDAVAVQDGGDLARGPKAAGGAAAGRATGLGREGYLGHRWGAPPLRTEGAA